MKFYTSDLHFNHVNILNPEYTRRSQRWATLYEMNEGIIAAYNAIVGEDDEVYVIGDVAMGVRTLAPALITRLRGRKHLVYGNHDMKKHEVAPHLTGLLGRPGGFESIQESLVVHDEKYRLFLAHIPQSSWKPGCHFHLCGHVHESFTRASWVEDKTLPEQGMFVADPTGLVVNVGIDVSDYKPCSLEQLLARPHYEGKRHRI